MWPNPQETADLVTFTEEILNEKLRFLCSVSRLKENRFLHDIKDCAERIQNSGNGPKITKQFFLHLANVDVQRQTLLNKITNIGDASLVENRNHAVYIVITITKSNKV